ncbi:MAG: cysteine hydrolase [Treponema sp.]|nr:cysteine hydrolase [Treponema sp.]
MELHDLLTKTKCAVIVVDVQNDYCSKDGACAKKGSDVSGVDKMIPNLQFLLDTAHKNGMPVIFIQTIHTDETDAESWTARSAGKSSAVCRPGSWGIEFYKVSPQDNDIIVNKHRYSAFIHTRLESVLHTLKAETIIVCGVATNVCVESTARDGYMLDFNLILAEDCCSEFIPESHELTCRNIRERFGKVATSQEIAAAF